MPQIPHSVQISEATDSDVAALGDFFWAMWTEAGPDAPGFAGATEEVIAEIAEPDAIAARIGGPDRRMFIARQHDSVVGFAATRAVDDTTTELAGIVVLQSLVGQGIGSLLLAAATETSRREGLVTIEVQTETDNSSALDFYLRAGFRITGETTTCVEGTKVAVTELALAL